MPLKELIVNTMTITEIKTVNNYFQNFVIANQSDIYFPDKIQQKYVINIAQGKEVHFESNWTYLMALLESIEKIHSIWEIKIANNYCCFELENGIRIQDKGTSKMNAIYNCCFRILNEFWKEEAIPVEQKFVEPFDEEDLL